MSADYERKLHRAVAQFVKEADKKYPNWSERNDNGEWGIGLDKFDDICLLYTSPSPRDTR